MIAVQHACDRCHVVLRTGVNMTCIIECGTPINGLLDRGPRLIVTDFRRRKQNLIDDVNDSVRSFDVKSCQFGVVNESSRFPGVNLDGLAIECLGLLQLQCLI